MLDDTKAAALVDNLAGQWLYTRQLAEITPDPTMFPAAAFDQSLREAMRAETHLFLREVLFGDHSALDLLQVELHLRSTGGWPSTTACPRPRGLGNDMRRVSLSRPATGRPADARRRG